MIAISHICVLIQQTGECDNFRTRADILAWLEEQLGIVQPTPATPQRRGTLLHEVEQDIEEEGEQVIGEEAEQVIAEEVEQDSGEEAEAVGLPEGDIQEGSASDRAGKDRGETVEQHSSQVSGMLQLSSVLFNF